MASLRHDGNSHPIQVIGPRGDVASVGKRHFEAGLNPRNVNLEVGKIYRVTGEYDFHFRLGDAGDTCDAALDEIQPGMVPMLILTAPGYNVFHYCRHATTGAIWIAEWDA